MHIGASEDCDVGRDAETIEEIWKYPDGGEKEGCGCEAEVDTVDQRVEAVFVAARAEGLGDESIEPD